MDFLKNIVTMVVVSSHLYALQFIYSRASPAAIGRPAKGNDLWLAKTSGQRSAGKDPPAR
jgi:hypothetical protein